MSEENLKQLAKNDDLSIMYEDNKSQLQAQLDEDLVAAVSDNVTTEEEQEMGLNPTNARRSVSFGRDQIREFQGEEPVSQLASELL